MKTTVDLPDELLRTLKIRAASTNRTLRSVMADLLRRGLATADDGPVAVTDRVEVPLVQCAHPATPGQEATPGRIAQILVDDETASLVL